MKPSWSEYEDAARKVLADLRQTLGLSEVEGKQSLAGASGTNWEIDAKAWRTGTDGFLVIEVRRLARSRLKQEDVAAIAYRIQDVGAAGGIVVSPLPMQKGANLVAASADIAHVRLSPESTTESYLAEFMGSRFLGASISEAANAQASCDAEMNSRQARWHLTLPSSRLTPACGLRSRLMSNVWPRPCCVQAPGYHAFRHKPSPQP